MVSPVGLWRVGPAMLVTQALSSMAETIENDLDDADLMDRTREMLLC